MTVNQFLPRPVLSHQQLVVFELDTRFADNVPRVEELKLRLIQHVFADLAHVSDQVRHEPFSRIKAPISHDGVELGQLSLVRLNESLVIGRNVFFEINWLVLRHVREVVNFVFHFFRIHVQARGHQIGIGA